MQLPLVKLQLCLQTGWLHKCPCQPWRHLQVFGAPSQYPWIQPGNAIQSSQDEPFHPSVHLKLSWLIFLISYIQVLNVPACIWCNTFSMMTGLITFCCNLTDVILTFVLQSFKNNLRISQWAPSYFPTLFWSSAKSQSHSKGSLHPPWMQPPKGIHVSQSSPSLCAAK